jgi:pimeloyl-ACP methyl ester carboxylesterase
MGGRLRAAAPLALALACLGCGSPQPALPRAPAVIDECARTDLASGTQVIRFSRPGGQVDGVVLGAGAFGVVLAHQSNGDLCQWLPYGRRLQGMGRQVLAFDYSGADIGGDVVAAAAELTRRGATRILLVGASMGGTAVLAAAVPAPPGVVGVASLSGSSMIGRVGAMGSVRQLTIPALFMAQEQDADFATDARALYEACGSPRKQLDVRPGVSHGVELVSSDDTRAVLETWMAGVAGPG